MFYSFIFSICFDDWSKYLPSNLYIITEHGEYRLELKKDKSLGHNVNVVNLMNCMQIAYHQNTDVLDGVPDYLCFDISIVKNNNGTESNPDTLKLNVDISYGDAMVSSFSIEKPNKVTISHYTGKNSKYDPKTKFSFTDRSLADLIQLFNRFGYKLSINDFKFLDKEDDSFRYKDDKKQLYTDKIGKMDLEKNIDSNKPINLNLKSNI